MRREEIEMEDGQKERLNSDSAAPKQNSFWKSRPAVYSRWVILYLLTYTLSYYLAFAVKTDGFQLKSVSPLNESAANVFLHSLPWVLAIKMLVMFFRRSYRTIGLYATFRDLRFIIMDSVASFAFVLIWFKVAREAGIIGYNVLFSVLLLDLIFSIMFRGGLRLGTRFYRESILPRLDPETEEKRAFLLGANDESAHVANIINTRHNSGYRVVGFITIHEYKVNMKLGTLPIVAYIDDITEACRRYDVNTVLFVAGSLPGKTLREFYDRCDKNGIQVLSVPRVEFPPGTKIPIRDVNVNDLLRRSPIELDTKEIKSLITGRRVMVTGAGGSIGSEICRQIMRFEPQELFILGRGENRIFFLDRELRALGKSTQVTPIIADIANADRINEIFAKARPEIVFHAAAHKHVPLMEANIPEAIRNNIYGTKVIADASDRYGAVKFVMVSTDKAVNPSSVMGCSKQMAERYVNSLAVNSKTKFIVTRFGNVLGSNGSVVPIFTRQIQNGGPITITDCRMTRYFMTIPEASQLVLEAAAMGNGGEIFVLDMGDPVRIEDLAKDLIRLAGLPENAIEIKEVGLRPGEKLYEELYFESETRIQTNQERLFAAEHRRFDHDEVQAQLDELLSMLNGPQEKIRECLQKFVPEYKPTILTEKK